MSTVGVSAVHGDGAPWLVAAAPSVAVGFGLSDATERVDAQAYGKSAG